MRRCPNCGQDVAADSDRFCPHCGVMLTPAAAGAGDPAAGAASARTATPQGAYQPAGQSSAPSGSGYTYAPPDPGGYSAPAYTQGAMQGSNLPSVASGQRPSTMRNMLRTVGAMEVRGLLILAAVIIVAIIAVVTVFHIIAWFFSLWWLWLIIIAAVAYSGRRRYRRRRLP